MFRDFSLRGSYVTVITTAADSYCTFGNSLSKVHILDSGFVVLSEGLTEEYRLACPAEL